MIYLLANKYKIQNLIERNDIEEIARDVVKILSIMLRKEDKVASGALLNSLSYRIVDTDSKLQILIDSNDYMEQVDQGRKPGTYPNMNELARWLTIRGINKDALFPIAKKIFEKGYKGSFVIDKTIREIETSPQLSKKFEDSLTENISELVIAEFDLKK